MKFVLILCLLLTVQSQTPYMRLRGLRIDASYFYDLFPNLSPAEITQKIMTDARSSGVNTLFIYAYNSVFGALYPTEYPYTITEGGYGRVNILKELANVAKSYGLKVIGVVPVNNFKSVWDQKPSWRARTNSGQDYTPKKDIFLLSAWHPEFKVWLKGFYRDLLEKNPNLDGIEAVEPSVDYNWLGDTDYNVYANEKFKSLYPKGNLGDQDWFNLRAQGLTDLIGIMSSVAHSYYKESYLIQTWPAKQNGQLFSNEEIKFNLGLNLNDILNLNRVDRPDYIMAELIWQQWAAEYGSDNFTGAWTRRAALKFINFVRSRAQVVVHLEISEFEGQSQRLKPTKEQFLKLLQSLRDLPIGIEVYDYNQISKAQAWSELRQWY